MNITLKIKKLTRQDKVLACIDYDVPFSKGTVGDLICQLVAVEVKRYNEQQDCDFAFVFASEEEIQKSAQLGKVSFNNFNREHNVELSQATANAFLAFNDGLVKLFINEQEYSDLNTEIELKENDELILFRLAFLSGRMY